MITIGATRFNNTTYKENKDWREGNKWMGCIYPVPKRISKELRRNAMIVVLEMNNTTNAIMGIGCIKNRIRTETQYRIYGDRNYNRYVYHSKYRIDASEFSKELKECIGILEGICFKGENAFKAGTWNNMRFS